LLSAYDVAMAILVDRALWPRWDRYWCHLISDTSLQELHDFARMLGLPENAFGGDHYDIPSDIRLRAIELGAREVSSRDIVEALLKSGLRKRVKHQP
ncbi:MAG: DUF4031 domain-containing protein, partial [Candidatus Nanopelagicales bacterium]